MMKLIPGQKESLTKVIHNNKLDVGFGWQFNGSNFSNHLELSIVCTGNDDRIIADTSFLHEKQSQQLLSGLEIITHPENKRYQKRLIIDFSVLPKNYSFLYIILSVENSSYAKVTFRNANNVFLGTINKLSQQEMHQLILPKLNDERSVQVAKIYKYKDEWRIQANASGYKGGLRAVLNHFGGENISLSGMESEMGGGESTQSVIQLQKGQKIPLKKLSPNKDILIQYSWQYSLETQNYNLEPLVFLLDRNGQISTKADVIFPKFDKSGDGSIAILRPTTGYKASIGVRLDKVNPQIEKILFLLTINDRSLTVQKLELLLNFTASIYDSSLQKDLAEFIPHATNEYTMILLELYRYNNEWRIMANGSGFRTSLEQILKSYGAGNMGIVLRPPPLPTTSQQGSRPTPRVQASASPTPVNNPYRGQHQTYSPPPPPSPQRANVPIYHQPPPINPARPANPLMGRLFKARSFSKEEKERVVLQLAQQKNGRITAIQIAAESNLTVEECEKILAKLSGKGYAELKITDTGMMLYEFPSFLPESERGNIENFL